MKATIESDIVQEALKIAMRLAPPVAGSITLQATGGKLFLRSASDLSRCSILLPCTLEGKALFAVPPEALRDAVKGRKTVDLEYSKTMLNIKSGRYHTSLSTMDAIQIDESEDKAQGEETKEWKLTSEQATWLKGAVATVALKPTSIGQAFMPIAVRLTKKSAFVCCYDENHMAHAHGRDITGAIDFTLPLDMLSSVLDVFNKHSFQMRVTQSAVYVRNPVVDVVLSLPHTEDSVLTTDVIIDKARQAAKADGSLIVLPKDKVLMFLDNARSVATKERSEVRITTKAGVVTFLIKTTNGTSTTKLKSTVKDSLEFGIDFEFFDEAVRKSDDTVQFKVVDDAFLSMKTKASTVLLSLNNDDGSVEDSADE